MDKIAPSASESSNRSELRRFQDLPESYQNLGRACEAAGISDVFFEVVEANLDFGQARSALVIDLSTLMGREEVYEWLEKFDVPLPYDFDNE